MNKDPLLTPAAGIAAFVAGTGMCFPFGGFVLASPWIAPFAYRGLKKSFRLGSKLGNEAVKFFTPPPRPPAKPKPRPAPPPILDVLPVPPTREELADEYERERDEELA